MRTATDTSWPRRLISPSGLAFALLCLFLPFIGVSCEGGMGAMEVRVSGWDMAVNGQPSVTGTGLLGASTDQPSLAREFADAGAEERVGVRPLMLGGVLAMLVALVLGTVLPSALGRAVAGLAATGAAALAITANEITMLAALRERITADAQWLAGEAEVGTRFGFWTTLAVLAAVLGNDAVQAVLARRADRSAAAAGPPAHGPPAPTAPPGLYGPPGPPGPGGPGAYGQPGADAPPPGAGLPLGGGAPWPPAPPPPAHPFPPADAGRPPLGRRDDPYGPPFGERPDPYGPPYG
ncbi:hypothetical protein [Nocardiopsis trehalosi]|uniref:hypothetical protein n=1 Tax=Nocardiopsis trehalosi TaxID=109329 RepID=UPI000835A000|nr:hypothetical protein [Nocardiopsis trehalosi]